MTQEQVVPAEEQVLTPEPVPGAETLKQAPPTALTETQVRQMIAEATAKAVAEAKDVGRRELQSQQDRNKKIADEALRRQRIAESSEMSARLRLRELDPDTANAEELAQLRAERQESGQREAEEARRREAEDTYTQFKVNKRSQLQEMGVDPDDKRIDWAADAQTLMDADHRIMSSAAKVKKEGEKALQESLEKRFKDMESKLRQSLGLDSVDTSQSVGAASDGIPLDRDKFVAWLNSMSQEEYETKYADKVKALQRAGKIK